MTRRTRGQGFIRSRVPVMRLSAVCAVGLLALVDAPAALAAAPTDPWPPASSRCGSCGSARRSTSPASSMTSECWSPTPASTSTIPTSLPRLFALRCRPSGAKPRDLDEPANRPRRGARAGTCSALPPPRSCRTRLRSERPAGEAADTGPRSPGCSAPPGTTAQGGAGVAPNARFDRPAHVLGRRPVLPVHPGGGVRVGGRARRSRRQPQLARLGRRGRRSRAIRQPEQSCSWRSRRATAALSTPTARSRCPATSTLQTCSASDLQRPTTGSTAAPSVRDRRRRRADANAHASTAAASARPGARPATRRRRPPASRRSCSASTQGYAGGSQGSDRPQRSWGPRMGREVARRDPRRSRRRRSLPAASWARAGPQQQPPPRPPSPVTPPSGDRIAAQAGAEVLAPALPSGRRRQARGDALRSGARTGDSRAVDHGAAARSALRQALPDHHGRRALHPLRRGQNAPPPRPASRDHQHSLHRQRPAWQAAAGGQLPRDRPRDRCGGQPIPDGQCALRDHRQTQAQRRPAVIPSAPAAGRGLACGIALALAGVGAATAAPAPRDVIRTGGPSSSGDPKVAVVASSAPRVGKGFTVVDAHGRTVLRSRLRRAPGSSRPWRHAAVGDLTRVTRPGRYRVRAAGLTSRPWVVQPGAGSALARRLLRGPFPSTATAASPTRCFAPPTSTTRS